jgi:hypothetical protein
VSIINQAAIGMGLSFDDLFKMLNSDQTISFIDSMDGLVIEGTEQTHSESATLSYFNNLSPTSEELELVRKYRVLDKKRKAIIEYILNMDDKEG